MFIKTVIFSIALLFLGVAPGFVSSMPIIQDGDLIRAEGMLDVFIVKIVGVKKFKRLILNPAIFESYGHLRWEDVKDVPLAVVDEYTASNLVIEVYPDGSVADSRVFLVSSSSNSDVGERRWLNISDVRFGSLGFDWDAIYHVNHREAAPDFYPYRGALTTDQELLPWAEGMKTVAVAPTPVSTPAPQVVDLDPCSNALGNGDEIISGPAGPENGDRDNPFHSLTVHPTDSNYILVGTERNGFLRSLDGGVTWKRFRYGLRHDGGGYPEIYDIAIAESNPNVIYAATVGSPSPLTRKGADSGVYKSIDGGQTWARKNCGIQDNGGRTTGVFVDPKDYNHAFIGISGGETSYFTADQPAGIYIDGGIYETVDGGEQWKLLDVAPDDRKQELRYFRSPSLSKNSIYIFGSTFDDDRDIGIVKSNDNGKTWQQLGLSVKNKFEGSFDVSSDGNTVYINSNEYSIYKSINGGATWTSHDVIRTSGYTLTVSPSDSNRVIFGQVDGLYLSTNGLSTVTKALNVDENGGRISDLVFSPSNPNIVYMITDGYLFYKSVDSGVTFTQIGNLRNDVLDKIP